MGADRMNKPKIKQDGDGSSTGKRRRVPPVDWLALLIGLATFGTGAVLVFGLGIGLMT